MKALSAISMGIALTLPAAWGGLLAQVAEKKVLTLDGARKVLAAAVAEARKRQAGGAIAVVDDGGHLVALERLDNTFAAASDISIGKARTAARFKKATKAFEDIIGKGRTSMVAIPDFVPLQGGVPVIFEGQVVGAIGVSGAHSAQEDEDIANAGAGVLTAASTAATKDTPAPAVTYLEKEAVDAAFRQGIPLHDHLAYAVHASRRDKPGQAEVHQNETDVIYVLQGSATFVTGGTLVDGRNTAPREVRGSSIRGGETRRISKGDLIIVPQGVAHWFKDLEGPVTYYVVKVKGQEGALQ